MFTKGQKSALEDEEDMVLHCSCCGEEVTMPKWNNRKPYGYTCFSRLFGKTKSERYVQITGKVTVIRNWDDYMDKFASLEEAEKFKGKSYIIFTHPEISARKMQGSTDHAINYDGNWYVPESSMKEFWRQVARKFIITPAQLHNLLKG